MGVRGVGTEGFRACRFSDLRTLTEEEWEHFDSLVERERFIELSEQIQDRTEEFDPGSD